MWLPRLLEPEPEILRVTISGPALAVGGRTIALPDAEGTLVGLLGPPSMMWDLINTLWVWDELGLVAYQPPGVGPCSRSRLFWAS
jgi:hypothetical protein